MNEDEIVTLEIVEAGIRTSDEEALVRRGLAISEAALRISALELDVAETRLTEAKARLREAEVARAAPGCGQTKG